MSKTKSKSSTNAITSLKADHQKVKGLFDEFEKANDRTTKMMIVSEALEELSLHATLEEEIFYPAVRQAIDDEDGVMNEADEEHHVAKILIAELEEMDGNESHYDAKFKVLAENVRHHIKEEEGNMFPKAQKTEIDFDALGEEMLGRKDELLSEGVPVTDEADMVATSEGHGDSPAETSKQTATSAKKRA
jgi:hemerythrin superfamily protein